MSVEEVQAKVERYLAEEIPDHVVVKPGQYLVSDEIFCRVRVLPWEGSQKTVVRVEAEIVQDVPVVDELWEWIANVGNSFYFGKTQLHRANERENDLVITHVLLGDHLDRQELMSTIRTVVKAAIMLQEDAVDRFGGHVLMPDGSRSVVDDGGPPAWR